MIFRVCYLALNLSFFIYKMGIILLIFHGKCSLINLNLANIIFCGWLCYENYGARKTFGRGTRYVWEILS